jgi:L-alanine-DL-glutamate epimerase-like enolase superfamily enzyme
MSQAAAIAQPVDAIEVDTYTIPTDAPEGDGTLVWSETTIVIVHAHAGESVGLGYSYADTATAELVRSKLAGIVCGMDADSPQRAWDEMVKQIRNLGRPGICSMAIAAVDIALWDLKARRQQISLGALLGATRESAAIYGSGGFTTYDLSRLCDQLAEWVAAGIPRVKMKVGSDLEREALRVRAAREAIGTDTALFVDANGACSPTEALVLAREFAKHGVSWFEEPVSSDDLGGLRYVREHIPTGIAIAAGEYIYDLAGAERMLTAEAVDVLQADATRCGGITELLRIDALCRARNIALSLHCAPQVHAHVGVALDRLVHVEYFHDHQRIERMLFDGLLEPHDGALWPQRDRVGMGLELRRADAEQWRNGR